MTVTLDGTANDGGSGENDNVTSTVEVVRGSQVGDSLTGGSYFATLIGGGGGAIIVGTSGQPSYITAGFDDDPSGASIDLANSSATDGYGGTDSFVNVYAVSGSPFADTILGSVYDDTLAGNGGGDWIEGGIGDDSMVGGRGNDTYYFNNEIEEEEGFGPMMFAGFGADIGQDTISEADDLDTDHVNLSGMVSAATLNLSNNTSAQTVSSGYLKIRLDSTSGNGVEDIEGTSGNDSLTGNARHNSLRGGLGNDTLKGGNGNDTFLGGGADSMSGENGSDTASYTDKTSNLTITIDNTANDGATGEGDNVRTDIENIVGGSGNDSITGSSSDNVIDGGLGADVIDGSTGSDTIDYTTGRTTGVSITLGGSNSDSDSLTSIENVNGGPGNDVITGTSAAESLSGGAGSDTIRGLGGNDSITGGLHNDLLIGNSDTIGGGTDADSMSGGAGNDTLVADAADPITGLLGGIDDDELTFALESAAISVNVPQQIQIVVGGAGNDSFDASAHTGGPVILYGNAGDDTLEGGAAADTIYGGDNSDSLFGAGGDDNLEGDAGDDTLSGGDGFDGLLGGSGLDVLNAIDGDVDRLFGAGGPDTFNADTIDLFFP